MMLSDLRFGARWRRLVRLVWRQASSLAVGLLLWLQWN